MALSDHARAEIDELLASMDMLEDEDVDFLAEMWEKEDQGARGDAWAVAKPAIEKAGLMKELDRVRMSVGEWMRTSSSDFQGIEGLMGSSGGPAGARRAAAPAFIDAAAAILAGDALAADAQQVLARPWRSLTEEGSES